MLFVDQAGSTAQRSSLGDATADAIRRSCVQLITAGVESGSGAIVKFLGDGAVAAFDSASAALYAAIQIMRNMDAYNRRTDTPGTISLRIGISAGDVTWEDDDVFGTPVVEAARLESAAAADSIYCSDVVRMLAGSRAPVALESVGPLELKGLPDPVVAWCASWRPAGTQAPPLPARLEIPERLPFVGRARELDVLHTAQAATESGRLGVVMIGGEPGAGKSRLAREFGRAAHEAGAAVVKGRCAEGVGRTYLPYIQAMETVRGWDPPLCDRLGSHPGQLVRLQPSDAGQPAPALVPGDDDTERSRFFAAVASWLEDLSSELPLVFIVDDLHWADRVTLELTESILRAECPARVLMVVTYRDGGPDSSPDLERFLLTASRESCVQWISLEGLRVESVAELLPGGHSPGLAAEVHRHTGGNPFFVGAVAESLAAGAGGAAAVTQGVREFVTGRLALLDPTTNAVLDAIAVAGAEIDVGLLYDVVGLDERALDDALGAAIGAHVLVEIPGSPTRYRFAHALVRDAVYERVPPAQKSQLHNAVAAGIERRYAARIDEHLDELVHHHSRSTEQTGGIDRVIQFGADAGHAAMRSFAYDRAVSHFEAVVAAMDHPNATVDSVGRCRALLDLGVAQRRNHHPDARATLLNVSDMAADLGQHDILVAAALANRRPVFWTGEPTDPERSFACERALASLPDTDSAARATLLADLSAERYLAGDDDAHRRLADDALAMAQRLGDVPTMANVLHVRNLTLCRPDTVQERIELSLAMREAVAASDASSRFEYGSWVVPSFAAAVEVGDLALAEDAIDALKSLSFEMRDVNLAFNVRLLETCRAAIAGRESEVLELAEQVLDLGNQARQRTAPIFHLGFRFHALFHLGRLGELVDELQATAEAVPTVPILHFGHALARAEIGQPDVAAEVLGPFAERRFAQVPVDRDWLVTMCWAARVAWHVGDRRAGALLHDRLAPYADHCATNITNWFGRVDGFLALLDALAGDLDAAETRFARTAAYHDRLPAPVARAVTMVDWAETVAPVDRARAVDLAEAALGPVLHAGLDGLHRRIRAIAQHEQPHEQPPQRPLQQRLGEHR